MKKIITIIVLLFLNFTQGKADEISEITLKFRQWKLGSMSKNYNNDFEQQGYKSMQIYAKKAETEYQKYDFKNPSGKYDLSNKADINEAKSIFSKIIYPLSLAYHIKGDKEHPNRYYQDSSTRKRIINIFNYLNSKGWEAGVDMKLKRMSEYPEMGYIGVYASIYLSISGYAHSVFLMKDVLKEENLFDREMQTLDYLTKYISPSERIENVMNIDGFNTDCIRTMLLYRLIYILAQDENADDREANLVFFRLFMKKSLQLSNAWADFIKPDYSTYHHRGIYGNTYGPSGLNSASLIAWLLDGTSYQLPEESINNLGNALLALRINANKYEVPRGIGGRFPYKLGAIYELIPAYAYLSDINQGKAPEIRGAFMRLFEPENPEIKETLTNLEGRITHFNSLGSIETLYKVYSKKYTPEKTPNGYWYKPFGGLAIHRRGEWMVSVKGFSKYIWDYEQGRAENNFGRNASSGVIQIYANGNPVNSFESGYQNDGWDWNRLPGSTTMQLDLSEFPPRSKARRFSKEYFLGGCHINQTNGVWGMKYSDIQTPSEKELKANKSVFFFDDKIIALGSDIRNGDDMHNVETTIFQTGTAHRSARPLYVNFKEYNKNNQIRLNKPVCITDPCGNSYFIPHADNLQILKKEQTSRDHADKTDTKGEFAVALFNHGKDPKNAGYEYVTLVQNSKKELKDFAKKSNQYYDVIQKDSVAHIVRYKPLNLKAFVIFNANSKIKDKTLLNIDNPGFVIMQQKKGSMTVSVSNPEMGWLAKDQFLYNINDIQSYDIVYAKSKILPITITLKGKWKLKNSTLGKVLNANDQQTVIQVDCINGMTKQFKLEKFQ